MDMVTLYLKDALGEGCPVCRILRKYEDSEMEVILYEHVNDPDVRREFRKSLGLCTHHAWKLLGKAYSDPLLGPHGIAVIYSDMLSTYIDELEGGAKEGGECFLCRLVEEKERTTVETFAERIDEILPEYERSGSILCKRHYEMVMDVLSKRNPEKAEELKRVQLEKLRELRDRLNSFVDKFDYQAESAPTEEEIASLPRAIEALKGLETGVERTDSKSRSRGLGWLRLKSK